jgi:ATP-binding protein involved in chromosome partitioning
MTDNDQQQLSPQIAESIRREAMAGLVMAAQLPESGLSDADHAQTRARVLGVSCTSDGRPQVRVDSTGLSLDQKLVVERTLLRHFGNQELSDVAIYFQRSSSASARESAPAPVKKKHPLGLNLETKPIAGVKAIIAVASGKGGVGKSTVSTNLAAGLARLGLKTGLMDCDVYGPSSPLMLGVSGSMPVEKSKLIPLEGHGVKVVSFGFLTDVKSPVIWRGPMVAKAIEQLCYDVAWGELDVLVLDLPPGTGDVQMTLAEKLPLTGSVIVTTPQDVALIDAHKAVSMFEKMNVPVLGVVENMSHYTCTACGQEEHIFGSESFAGFLTSRKLGLITSIPLSRNIRELSDQGQPVVLDDTSKSSQPYRQLADFVKTAISQTLRVDTNLENQL